MKLSLSKKNIWEHMPPFLKANLGQLLRFVPLSYLIGGNFRKQVLFLDKAQWWSAEQNREYQLAQLKSICGIAYNKSVFYQNVFDSCGFQPNDLKSIEDFQGVPLLEKTIINSHIEDMLTLPKESSKVDYITTGGTSGVPLRFYINSSRSQVEYAYLISSWKRAGYKLGDKTAVFRGKIVSQDRNNVYQEYDPVMRQQFYSTFNMADADMHRYVEHLRTIGPCFLHVYPSAVANLARFLRRRNIKPPQNIQGIIAESEIVYSEQREMVEDVFGCRYFSSYGHTEKLVAAAGCEKSNNYHIWPTYGFFELLDDDGNPVVTPGQSGEIVGTGFINTVVPFIRYRTGDYATYVGDQCTECGRQHIVISDIQGHRMQENLVAKDGSMIVCTALYTQDDTFDQVQQMQFYQDTPGEAVLKIVPAPNYNESSELMIYQSLRRKLSENVKCTIQCVESIPLTQRGKTIFVDQRIDTAG